MPNMALARERCRRTLNLGQTAKNELLSIRQYIHVRNEKVQNDLDIEAKATLPAEVHERDTLGGVSLIPGTPGLAQQKSFTENILYPLIGTNKALGGFPCPCWLVL